MAGSGDANFEELFVRIVPVEVCCIHSNSSSNGSPRVSTPKGKASNCLRMQGTNAGRPNTPGHFPDSPGAGPMPGSPYGSPMMNPAGLYPNISNTDMSTCFCPNCCSNAYTTDEQGKGNSSLITDTVAAGLPPLAVQRLAIRVLGQKARFGSNGRVLPGSFRLEMSSDNSLFFLFLGTITEAGFQDIKEACDLSLTFQQLPGLLLQLLDLLLRQPSTYLARLMMQSDGSAALEFAQTLGFKTISLMVLPRLEPAPSTAVRGYVTARHNAVLERCAGAEAELAELKALVRQRCPNLLLQANKANHHHSRADMMA